MSNPNLFQVGLRRIIEPFLFDERYYHEYEVMSYLLAKWHIETYSETQFENLMIWVNDIFLFDGPDRTMEMAWESLICRPLINDEDSNIPVHLSNLIETIKSEHLLRVTEARESFMLSAKQTSSWDEALLFYEESEKEDIVMVAQLICNYNVFSETFGKHTSDMNLADLTRLWQWGKGLGLALGIPIEQISFPGIWTLGSRD